jgi:hypothetical protein
MNCVGTGRQRKQDADRRPAGACEVVPATAGPAGTPRRTGASLQLLPLCPSHYAIDLPLPASLGCHAPRTATPARGDVHVTASRPADVARPRGGLYKGAPPRPKHEPAPIRPLRTPGGTGRRLGCGYTHKARRRPHEAPACTAGPAQRPPPAQQNKAPRSGGARAPRGGRCTKFGGLRQWLARSPSRRDGTVAVKRSWAAAGVCGGVPGCESAGTE